jgi:hypothetical protein
VELCADHVARREPVNRGGRIVTLPDQRATTLPTRLFWDYDGPAPIPRPGETVTLPESEHPWSGLVATVDTAHGRKLTVKPLYRYPQWKVDLFAAEHGAALDEQRRCTCRAFAGAKDCPLHGYGAAPPSSQQDPEEDR